MAVGQPGAIQLPLSVESVLALRMGQSNYQYISDTVARTPTSGSWFGMIFVVTATTFATLTDSSRLAASNTITGVSFAAGTFLYGQFSAITLTSGSILAYEV